MNDLAILKLYSKLRRIVYRETDLNSLLQNVCELISNHSMYNSAWIITSVGLNANRIYKSKSMNSTEIQLSNFPCFQNAIDTEGLVVINNVDQYCKSCDCMPITIDAVVFAIELKYNDKSFGVLSASVYREYADNKFHRTLFAELAEDIAFAMNRFTEIIVPSTDDKNNIEIQKNIRTLSQALDQSPSIVMLTDLDGQVLYVNKRFQEVTGYPKSEILGVKANILKSGILNDKVFTDLWNTIQSGQEWNGRFCNQRKNGQLYWEQASISPFNNEQGQVEGYLKVGEDVGKLVQYELELRETNLLYLSVFDTVPTPIIIYQNNKIVDVNAALLRFSLLGSKDFLIGKDILDFVHPKHRESVKSTIDEALATNKNYFTKEAEFVSLEGNSKDVIIVSSPILYRGKDARLVVLEDITERNKWTKKILESEQKFRSIFDTIPDAISITRMADGFYIEINEGFSRITGYETNEVIGKTSLEIDIYANFEDRSRLINIIKEKGFIDNVEVVFKTKLGKLITCLVSSRIIEYNDEPFLLFVSHDISDRKMMEKELVKSKNKAEENDKLKSSFLANMSHEIRTPMNAIIGFSDLLKDEGLSHEEQISYINIIQSKGDELMMLINDIIDVSKIESGALEIESEPHSVTNILHSLKKNFSSLIRQKTDGKVKFTVDDFADTSVYIMADSYRLNQVFGNLIGNAIKFTPKGSISISVNYTDEMVSFHVTDTGIGIAASKLQHIFSRFSQVNSRNDSLVGGTGLGLCISSNLLSLMDGKIDVESEESSGSTFTVQVPRVIVAEPLIKHQVIDVFRPNIDLSQISIALFESDHIGLVFLETIMKSSGAKQYLVSSLFDNFDDDVIVDLAIVNVDVSDIDLKCFTDEMKKKFPKIKLIGVTANLIVESEENILKLGFDSYLTKPFTKNDLFVKIKALI